MAELGELREDIKEIKSDLKSMRVSQDENFERMNGRVKTLELKQATQEGFEKAAKTIAPLAGGLDWKNVVFRLLPILASIIGLASALALIVGKIIT